MAERYVLCRPQGGLNDMLCQIEACCEYAAKFDRKVIVDTAFGGSLYFRDVFGRYFVSQDNLLILQNYEEIIKAAGDLIFPRFIADRIDNYQSDYDDNDGWVDSISRLPLTFDFAKNYTESMLLHHQAGGGRKSFNALTRLRIHNSSSICCACA